MDQKGSTWDFSKVPKEGKRQAEMLYLTDFEGDAWYELYNPQQQLSFGMKWDKAVFRYLWMWAMYKGSFDYPWYGRAYTIALEPWTSFPTNGLTQAVANGSAYCLSAHEQISTDMIAYVKDFH